VQIGEHYNPKKLFTGIFIPESMVRLPYEVLSPGSKLLFGRLVWHTSDDGDCFPARPTLAKEIGVSESSIRDYLKELEDQKFIERVRTGPGANSYNFPWHATLEASLRKKKKDGQPSADQENTLIDSRARLDGHPSVKPNHIVLTEDLTEENLYTPPTPSSEETLKDSDRPEEPFDHEALIRHLLSEKVLLNGRLKGLIRARDFAPGTPLTDAAAVCRREIIPSRFRASGQSRSRTPSDSRSAPMASRYPASPGWTSDCDFCAWDKLYDPEGIFTPADKERAFPYWRDYSDEERIACAEATPRYIRDTDQDYVMRPYNFLKNKEFIRKPKKPKRSKSEMEKEAVLAAFQKARATA
jgi:hypothetical protein